MSFNLNNSKVKIRPVIGDFALGSSDMIFLNSRLIFNGVARCKTELGESTFALVFKIEQELVDWEFKRIGLPPSPMVLELIEYLKATPFLAALPGPKAFIIDTDMGVKYSTLDLQYDLRWCEIEQLEDNTLVINSPNWSEGNNASNLSWILGASEWEIERFRMRYDDEFLGITKEQLRKRFEFCTGEERQWFMFRNIF